MSTDPSPGDESRSETGWWRIYQGRLAAVLLTLAFGVLLVRYDHLPQRTVRNALFDQYQQVFPRQTRGEHRVVVVAIDDRSLAEWGQWPWKRDIMTALVESVARAGPTAIGLDMIFDQPDRHAESHPTLVPSQDHRLADALNKAGAVVGIAGLDVDELPTGNLLHSPPIFQSDGSVPIGERVPDYPGVLRNLDVIHERVSRQGAINRIDEDDRVVRRAPTLLRIAHQLVPSLPLEMLRAASEKPVLEVELDPQRIHAVRVGQWRIPTDAQGQWWIHYSSEDFPTTSAISVMDGTIDAATLRDHFVLIGTAASGLGDRVTTPAGDRVGVIANAEALETVLQGRMLRRPYQARWYEAALLGLLSLVGILAVPKLSPMRALMCFVAAAGVTLVCGGIAFWQAGLLIDTANPVIGSTVVLAAMLMLSLGRAERQRENLRRDLQASAEKQARLDGELDAARRIQSGMLPDPARVVGDDPRVDLAALMRPARTVGGDLFDFFRLDAAHLFFMVGDVSGKGLPASLFMALSKALIKGAALNVGHDPGRGLTAAGKVIARENPESMFISVAACVLNLDTGELAWCCAGHESPYRVRAREQDTVRLDSAGGPALCVVESFDYSSERVRLAPGDLICLVTDGISEALNAAGEMFGSERLSAALAGAAREPSARRIIERVGNKIERFVDGQEAADDVTILVLRWIGPRTPPPTAR
ncbi:MAG: CHASE2 domain-containing protein [Panacagrimonas sp.]